MKRKSPKNHRRKQHNVCWHTVTLGSISSTGPDTVYFYGDNATTISLPAGSFSGSGFAAGDIIYVEGASEPKRAKKVHPARRRIPKRNNNGKYIITNADNGNCVTVKPVNNLATATKIANDRWIVEVTGCVV